MVPDNPKNATHGKAAIVCLSIALSVAMLSGCGRDANNHCELKYQIGGHSGGFYPPRPDGLGRLDQPILFEAAFSNWQNETGGPIRSDFKLLQVRFVEWENTTSPLRDSLIQDCVVIHSKQVKILTEWDTNGKPQSLENRPVRVTFHFYGDENRYLKSITYPVPSPETAGE